MNKAIERILTIVLARFRSKNVKVWGFLVFAVGVVNYALQQAQAAHFPVSEGFMSLVQWLSLTFVALSNPTLTDTQTEEEDDK